MGKKQTSIYFEEELIDALKKRSDLEKIKMNDFVVNSVEKQLLYPFISWRHLQNYSTIIKQLYYPKNEDPTRKAFFYLIAFDGILMEYFDKFYKVENKQEIVDIPEDLNDLLHPDFDVMMAAEELLTEGRIEYMEVSLEWLQNDEMQAVFNAVLIANGIIPLEYDLYRFYKSNFFPQFDPKKEYSIDTFEESLIYKQCSSNGKELLRELFSLMEEKGIEVLIRLGDKDAFTFTLEAASGKRLAIISLTNDLSGLRVGVYKLGPEDVGYIYVCKSKYDIQDLVNDGLIRKYQFIIKA